MLGSPAAKGNKQKEEEGGDDGEDDGDDDGADPAPPEADELCSDLTQGRHVNLVVQGGTGLIRLAWWREGKAKK